MYFNPDPKKPAQEIIFSRKKNANQQVDVFLNNQPIEQNTSTKHLGFILDQKLNFLEHLNQKISIVYKGIGILRKLGKFLPR